MAIAEPLLSFKVSTQFILFILKITSKSQPLAQNMVQGLNISVIYENPISILKEYRLKEVPVLRD